MPRPPAEVGYSDGRRMVIGAGGPHGGDRQPRRRQVRNATNPRATAMSARLAGSGPVATVGGVTNVSKTRRCWSQALSSTD